MALLQTFLDAGMLNDGMEIRGGDEKVKSVSEGIKEAHEKVQARVTASPDLLNERVIKAAVLLRMSVEPLTSALDRGESVSEVRKLLVRAQESIRELDSACA